MANLLSPVNTWRGPLAGWLLRIAAGGWLPARWFQREPPAETDRAARTGKLRIEIVSHCWQYGHLLAYQLSSLVVYPPQLAEVTMTVYHAAEDSRTVALLRNFGTQSVPNVTWNWRSLPRQSLFRRAIGRNEAALATRADWIWFTDCDLVFHDGCLDGLAEVLQGRRDALVYPRTEHCTSLLAADNPLLNVNPASAGLVEIDTSAFTERTRTRATGPLQITHGDVARACGYCNSLAYYQQPSETWCKAYEDRAFRWLLGTRGTPVDVPGVYRIRHVAKGRYTDRTLATRIRSLVRRIESSLKERRRNKESP